MYIRNNLTKDERTALKELQRDDKLRVCKHEVDTYEFDNQYTAFNRTLCKWVLFF